MGFSIEEDLERAGLEDLIRAAQSSRDNDTVAMAEIVRRFEPLALRLARTATDDEYLRDDLANVARIALIKAVRRHHPAIVGFPAYVKRYMKGAIVREQQNWLPPAPDEEPTIKLREPPEPNEEFEGAVIDRLAPWGDDTVEDTILELRPSQQRIATLRYIEDAPLSNIAQATGTSVSAVSQRLGTIHSAVREALAA